VAAAFLIESGKRQYRDVRGLKTVSGIPSDVISRSIADTTFPARRSAAAAREKKEDSIRKVLFQDRVGNRRARGHK
jgi:hypothetical protein